MVMETAENLLLQLNEGHIQSTWTVFCITEILSKRLFSTLPLLIKLTWAPFQGGGATGCDLKFGKELSSFIEHSRHATDWRKCSSLCINSITHRDKGTEQSHTAEQWWRQIPRSEGLAPA